MPIWSAHISMLFAERPYAERVGLARAHGFGWVETWWPAAPADREALVAGVAEHGVRVALVNTDGGDMGKGERGFLCDAAQEERARRAFLDGLELAARVRARSLHALVGCVPAGMGRAAASDQAAGMLRELVPEARRRGVAVVVEALNPHDAPGYLTPTPEDVVRLTGGEAGLLLDAYHMLRSGRDPAAEARRFRDAIGHVHVADSPGRGAPGTGELDLPAFLAALEQAGYDGPIGLEYDAAGDTPGSLAAFATGAEPV
jgi:hydroxypyruvate isomerase